MSRKRVLRAGWVVGFWDLVCSALYSPKLGPNPTGSGREVSGVGFRVKGSRIPKVRITAGRVVQTLEHLFLEVLKKSEAIWGKWVTVLLLERGSHRGH